MLFQFQKIKYGLLLVLLTTHLLCPGQSTLGKEFWVGFISSDKPDTLGLAGDRCFRLIATSERESTAVVSNPNTGWDTTFNVGANQSTIIAIPCEQVFCDQSNHIHNTGLYVTANDSISLWVYAYWPNHGFFNGHPGNYLHANTPEATLVLPVHALGNEYYIQTAPANSIDHSVFAVVATEDDTNVDITVSDETEDGPPAGTHFSVSLDAGQCYLLKTESVQGTPVTRNLTGTRVKARGGKRVAVFAGNECTRSFIDKWISYYTPPYVFLGGNRFEEQMPPTTRWGTRFVIVPTFMQDWDSIRVTSLYDKCLLRRNGTVIASINAGQTYTFHNVVDTLGEVIETSQPAMVSMAPLSKTVFAGSIKKSTRAWYYNIQRSMMPVVPMEQAVAKAVFRTVEGAEDDEFVHFVYIAAATVDVPHVRLDGRSIASTFRPVPGNPSFSFARMEIAAGKHNLSCEQGGFVAYVEGGRKTFYSNPDLLPWDIAAGYSFSVGSMTHDLSAQIIVNNQFSADNDNGFWFCREADPIFHLRAFFEVSHAEWDFGDGTAATGDTVTHHYEGTGDYTVTCEAYANIHGHDSLMRTLTTSVHIQEPIERDVWKTRCDSYYWHGTQCTESGVYPAMLKSLGGCDSLVNLHLTLLHSTYVDDAAVACETYLWRDSLYTESGTYQHFEGDNSVGCDSIAVLDLTIRHPIPFDILGHEQVAYATDIWPGVYRYYVMDSTLLDPGAVEWSCSNPDWVVTPVSDFSCTVFVRTSGQATLTATSAGCQSTASIDINATPFGVEEAYGDGVRLHPNPARDEVVVTGEGIRQVEIRNLLGQLVCSVENHDSESLPLSLEGLPKGVYLINIQLTNEIIISKKLIIN